MSGKEKPTSREITQGRAKRRQIHSLLEKIENYRKDRRNVQKHWRRLFRLEKQMRNLGVEYETGTKKFRFYHRLRDVDDVANIKIDSSNKKKIAERLVGNIKLLDGYKEALGELLTRENLPFFNRRIILWCLCKSEDIVR